MRKFIYFLDTCFIFQSCSKCEMIPVINKQVIKETGEIRLKNTIITSHYRFHHSTEFEVCA